MRTTPHRCTSHGNETIEVDVIAEQEDGFPAVAYCADCDTEFYLEITR